MSSAAVPHEAAEAKVAKTLLQETRWVIRVYIGAADYFAYCRQHVYSKRDSKPKSQTAQTFQNKVIRPLLGAPYRLKFLNRVPVSMRQHSDSATADLTRLCNNCVSSGRGGSTCPKSMVWQFIGGMSEGSSQGLRAWMSKYGKGIEVCTKLERSLQVLNKLQDVELSKSCRKVAATMKNELKTQVPLGYQAVSRAHPHLPYFHRILQCLEHISTFDPDDDDVIECDGPSGQPLHGRGVTEILDVEKELKQHKAKAIEKEEKGNKEERRGGEGEKSEEEKENMEERTEKTENKETENGEGKKNTTTKKKGNEQEKGNVGYSKGPVKTRQEVYLEAFGPGGYLASDSDSETGSTSEFEFDDDDDEAFHDPQPKSRDSVRKSLRVRQVRRKVVIDEEDKDEDEDEEFEDEVEKEEEEYEDEDEDEDEEFENEMEEDKEEDGDEEEVEPRVQKVNDWSRTNAVPKSPAEPRLPATKTQERGSSKRKMPEDSLVQPDASDSDSDESIEFLGVTASITTWQCMVCTYLNQISDQKCNMCNKPKQENTKGRESLKQHKRVSVPGGGAGAALSDVSSPPPKKKKFA